MRGAATIGALALVLVAAGCSTEETPGPAPQTSADGVTTTAGVPDGQAGTGAGPPDVSADTTAPVPAVDLGVLEGPLREQTRWVLDHLDPAANGPTVEVVEERFHADFLAEVPADQIEPVLAQFREGPALTLAAVAPVEEGPDGQRATRLTLSGEQPLRMSITVDGAGLITGLLFQPAPPPDLPEVGSWEELDEELAALGGTTRLYVGEVSDGTCTTTYGPGTYGPGTYGPDQQPAPSASVFKLIVLSAVVDAVAAGDLSWEEDLTLTAEVKSLPTGELQDRPDGELVPVGEAAALMIAISDNTATDLLMEAVGPDRLEEAVTRVTDDPDRLTPLLTTRQLFLLGWDAPELRAQWAEADVAGRSDLLAQLPDDLARLRGNPFAVTDPAWADGVDWFLTGEEICTAHAVLQEQAETGAGEPVRQILSANPGLPAPEAAAYQGFKGGSSVGVLAYSFYVETEDGAGRVLSVQVSHDGQILPTGYAELTQAGLALLVRE